MSICRICNHSGNKHFPECPFSNIEPRKPSNVPPTRLDYWLCDNDTRKSIKRDFEQGKYHYLGDGMFEKV
jgi:hypothetical protein